MVAAKKGLYANIKAKQDRIAHGSGETMRKPGSAGAPEAGAFGEAAKTSQAAKKAKRSAAAKKAARKTSAKRVSATKAAAK